MHQPNKNLTRIGIFYDGSYFLNVSNYYNYSHPKRSRLSLAGLHEFIRRRAAHFEATEYGLCQIVDAHYFRGRLNAQEASQRDNRLYYDRVFDDILMNQHIMTHYLPLKSVSGAYHEKGVDVSLALECYELALRKKLEIVVLIAGDGDYAPLIKKLHTINTKVMLMAWDFSYYDDYGMERVTKTSHELLTSVSYPTLMHDIIDSGLEHADPLVEGLFVPKPIEPTEIPVPLHEQVPEGELQHSEVLSLHEGFGFIAREPGNLFFHHSSVINCDFNDLAPGDKVEFLIGERNGRPIAENISKLE